MRAMHLKLGFFLLFGGFSNPLLAGALPSVVPVDIQQNITKNFNKSLPSLSIDKLEPSFIPNLYQVTSGPVVMYVTADGHYAISGDILDLRDGKTNLSEKARQRALAQALEKLGQSNMIVYAPPSSVKHRYTITIFTDLECIYCQKLHAQIDKMNQLGIKVRYVAFPKSGRNTPGYDSLVSVWCAPDRKGALNEAMLGRVKSLKCPNHLVDKQFNLGALAGVTGTPTFVVEGKLLPGYFEPKELLDIVQKMTLAVRCFMGARIGRPVERLRAGVTPRPHWCSVQ